MLILAKIYNFALLRIFLLLFMVDIFAYLCYTFDVLDQAVYGPEQWNGL